MLLLHTSDWHLGRSLHGADLGPAHDLVVDSLVQLVARERVDVVLVAGDVFDRAIAPVDAVRRWDRALARLTAAGAAVVVSSGNHDSTARLGAGSQLLDAARVHVRTGTDRLLDPVLLDDEHGPVAFYALPYLEPAVSAGPGVPRTQAGVVGSACARVAEHAAAAGHRRTVVLAHTWAAGGQAGDSERDIAMSPAGSTADPAAGSTAETVGTVDRVPVDAFEPFTYAALGHLHGAQRLRDGVRYSGSPVAFSFAERDQAKGSWLVRLDADGLGDVRWVPAPVHRPLVQLRGTLAELVDPATAPDAADAFVKAVVTDAARPQDGMRRLQQRYPHALVLQWEPEGAGTGRGATTYRARVAAATDDLDVLAGFVEHVRGTPASDDERTVLLAALQGTRQVEVTR